MSGHFTTAQQEIWRSRIKSEITSMREWEDNWGFISHTTPRSLDQGVIPTNKSNPEQIPQTSEQIRNQVRVG